MKLKTYQAWTMAEALAFVKTDLGADAVILHTRTFERGGFFGIGRKSVVEITAARAKDMPRKEPTAKDPAQQKDAGRAGNRQQPTLGKPSSGGMHGDGASEVLRNSAAARAYGVRPGAGGGPGSAAPIAANQPLDMESEREKTRRLAQAMAVQLE